MAGVMAYFGFGVSLFALLLAILSATVDDWHLNVTSTIGLWNVCFQGKCVSVTGDAVTSDLKAVRAMVLLGLLLIIGAVVGGVMKIFVKIERQEISFSVCGVLSAAGLFLLTGFALYADKLYKKHTSVILGSGFTCCVVAWLASWLAGALFYLEEYKGCQNQADKFYKQQTGVILGSGFTCCVVAWIASWLAGALFYLEEYKVGEETQPAGSRPATSKGSNVHKFLWSKRSAMDKDGG